MNAIDRQPLGEVCSVVSGGTPKRSVREYWEGGSIPWVKIGDLEQGDVRHTDERITLKGLEDSTAKLLSPGTVLVSIFATIGATGVLAVPACTNQAIAGVTPKGSSILSSRYIYYWLQSQRQFMESTARGVAQNNINLSVLRSMEIPLYGRQEQGRIIDVLTGVDTMLNDCEKLSEQLDELVKSRFIEMFGPNEGSVRLSTVCTLYNGDRGKNYPSGKDRVEEGIPFVNAGDLVDGRISFEKMDYITEERYKLLSGGKIERGDILYCLRGTLGKCAITDFSGGTIASSMMIIRPNQNKVLPAYLYQVLASPLVEKQLQSSRNGSTQPNLSAKSVGNYVIPLPHINRQREFTDFVARIDKLRFDALRLKKSVCCAAHKKVRK